MTSRYTGRRRFINADAIYDNLLEERGVGAITQYGTHIMRPLTRHQRGHLSVAQKRWGVGDRLYKLSAQYYGDARYWWVIARYNNRPTEAHFKAGDIVFIPLPRETIFDMYGV